jgi:DNA mismatch endonuclease (patch repair protein)
VFSFLRRRHVYFQKHYGKVPGKPDVALPSRKRAVFIDGDFWHGWRFSKQKGRLPTSYWIAKIEANIRRDRKNNAALHRLGWDVLRIWEHELKLKKSNQKTFNKILVFLQKDNE